MSSRAVTTVEAVQGLRCRDPTLKWISLSIEKLTDSQLVELVDCLLAHPDVVTRVYLEINQLTDETGVKLAQYLAASSIIKYINLSYNQFGSATYLALAAALRVNSSLRGLYLYYNQAVDQTHIDAAFVEALRLNPIRPAMSCWALYSHDKNDFERLYDNARILGPPSMLEQLRYCDRT